MPDLIANVQSVLATSPARWTALARIDPGLLARRPAPGEWSAIACLQHVVDTEHTVFRARVRAILAGRDFEAYDPETQGHADAIERTAPELAADLERMRAETLPDLGALAESDLERTARHAELGMVSLRELLNEWAAHDTMHVVQAERALMQAFIPGSGPWRPSFADHDAEEPR
jgi:hypothetical protein